MSALPDAFVIIWSGERVYFGYTDSNGQLVLPQVVAGTYHVMAYKDGYMPYIGTLTVDENEVLNIILVDASGIIVLIGNVQTFKYYAQYSDMFLETFVPLAYGEYEPRYVLPKFRYGNFYEILFKLLLESDYDKENSTVRWESQDLYNPNNPRIILEVYQY